MAHALRLQALLLVFICVGEPITVLQTNQGDYTDKAMITSVLSGCDFSPRCSLLLNLH